MASYLLGHNKYLPEFLAQNKPPTCIHLSYLYWSLYINNKLLESAPLYKHGTSEAGQESAEFVGLNSQGFFFFFIL